MGPVEEGGETPFALTVSAGPGPNVGEVCHRVWVWGQEGRGPSLCQAAYRVYQCPGGPACSTAGSARVAVCPREPILGTLGLGSGRRRALQDVEPRSPERVARSQLPRSLRATPAVLIGDFQPVSVYAEIQKLPDD